MKHYIFYQPMPGGPLRSIFGLTGSEQEPDAPKKLDACHMLEDSDKVIEFDSFEHATKYINKMPAEKFGEGNYWILPATPHLKIRQSMEWKKEVTL